MNAFSYEHYSMKDANAKHKMLMLDARAPGLRLFVPDVSNDAAALLVSAVIRLLAAVLAFTLATFVLFALCFCSDKLDIANLARPSLFATLTTCGPIVIAAPWNIVTVVCASYKTS